MMGIKSIAYSVSQILFVFEIRYLMESRIG